MELSFLSPKGRMLLSLVIFGTIGLVRRYIPLGSVPLAFLRAALGCLSMVVLMQVGHIPFHWEALRRRAPKLLLSGLLLGLDWVFFFEAFNHTTVAIATLCYYMAPVFMLAAAPLVFHEVLRRRKLVCAAITIGGMLLVSGVVGGAAQGGTGDFSGVVYALLGAFFYAAIIVLSKTITGLDPYEQTAAQLGTAALFLLVYASFTGQLDFHTMTGLGWGLTVLLGVVHTGLAYGIYFGSLTQVPAQTTAILSYVDPVVAVLLSVFVLQEPITELQLAGVCLVLGGMISGERSSATRRQSC